jgi:hypothetical protein
MEGWKIVERRATQRKRKTVEADKLHATETNSKPPMIQNSRRGKKSHQAMKTNTPAKKT